VFERDAVCCGSVSIPQCVTLQMLRSGPANVSSLATSLGITNSATTRLIDGLERRGLVARERSTEDRRRVHVHLTPEGEGESARLMELTSRAMASVLAQIPTSKHAQLLESLALIRGALEHTHEVFPRCG